MTHDPTPSTRPPSPEGRRRGLRGRQLGIGAALLAAFVAGTAWGGAGAGAGDEGAPAPGRRPLAAGPGVVPAAGTGAVSAAASCDALLAAYVERARDLVGPWGWAGPEVLPLALADGAGLAGGAAERSGGRPPRMREATASGTGTNVQERGVDEPDVVKTDGRLLLRLDGDELSTWDVTGRDPERLGTLGVDGIPDGEMLLVGDRVVVIGASDPAGADPRPDTEVAVVDLDDPADPVVLDRSSLDARLVEARQHGDAVRLVTTSGPPDLDFVAPGDGRSSTSALRANRRLVEETDLDDWLPQRLPCDAVAVPDAGGSPGTLAITTLLPAGDDPARPVAATGLLTGSDTAYVSADRVYAAAGPAGPPCCWEPVPRPVDPPFPGRPGPGFDTGTDPGTTQLHAFAIEGPRTTYVASGEVDGLVRDRWSMDERRGVLRLAVAASRATGSFSSVVTLVEAGDRLVEHGRLDGIGVNQDIRSVRWFDRMAVLVTFRRIDPLHVVDLTDDAEPTMRGELEVPGFSSYLHPLGTQRMIGVGEGPANPGRGIGRGVDPASTWGAQAALFDLTDIDDPRKVSQHHWGPGSVAGASIDPRQLTWLPAERLALTVVWRSGRVGRTGRASVLDFHDGVVDERSVEVEHGDDVEDVRLVPLPAQRSGGPTRVLLVTGDGVERFDLDG